MTSKIDVDLYSVAKLELSKMTELQNDMHFSREVGPDEKPEVVPSRSFPDQEKTSWSNEISESLRPTFTKIEQISFQANNKYDRLIRTRLIQISPEVSVADKYKEIVQICWPENYGHHLIVQGFLRSNRDIIGTIDDVYLDDRLQFMETDRDLYNQMIGNVEFLNEWSTYLPEYLIRVPQPFYYKRDRDTRLSLPLSVSTTSVITQEYTLRRRISELIRMRVLDKKTNTWIDCLPNLDYLKFKDDLFPAPDMLGDYLIQTPQEKEWSNQNYPDIYYDDIISIDVEKEHFLGETVEIELHSNVPVKTIFWQAENAAARKFHNFSNYTTNSNSNSKGWNPCKTIELKHKSSTRIPKTDHSMFDLDEPYHKAPAKPYKKGYNMLSFNSFLNSSKLDVGKVLDLFQTRLLITLADTNPSLKAISKENSSGITSSEELVLDEIRAHQNHSAIKVGDPYLIRIRMIVTRKLVFHRDKPLEIKSNDDEIPLRDN